MLRSNRVRPPVCRTGWLLLAAAVALTLDMLGSVMLRRGSVAAALIAALMILPGPPRARKEVDPDLARAANEFALGYVLTGDPELDEISRSGLTGLSATLTARTTVEPTPPVAVDLKQISAC